MAIEKKKAVDWLAKKEGKSGAWQDIMDLNIKYNEFERKVFSTCISGDPITMTERQWPYFVDAAKAFRSGWEFPQWFDQMNHAGHAVDDNTRKLISRLRSNLKSVGVTLSEGDYRLISYDIERDEST